MFVRFKISLTTVEPSVGAGKSLRVPPNVPIAVLKGSQITTFCMAVLLDFYTLSGFYPKKGIFAKFNNSDLFYTNSLRTP
jgi:hypothetical protein